MCGAPYYCHDVTTYDNTRYVHSGGVRAHHDPKGTEHFGVNESK